jgi:CheY-like chemotaxis protein
MHGGEVDAYSPGTNRGSEFVVKLPIIVETPVQTNPLAPQEVNKDNEQGMRILMIDDNVDVVDSISLFLEMSGHQVETANNGEQGILTAQSFAPDIILLDIGLPDIDGYQVAKKLREQPCTQGVLIIAMSGYAPNRDNQSTQPDHFDHYLVKPAKISELQNLINNFQRLKQ